MRTFPSQEALVAAYWGKLARSIDRPRDGKRQKLVWLKSGACSGVRQRFTDSRSVNQEVQRAVRAPRRREAIATSKWYQGRKAR